MVLKIKLKVFFKTSTPKDYGKEPYVEDERNKANQKHKNNLKKT